MKGYEHCVDLNLTEVNKFVLLKAVNLKSGGIRPIPLENKANKFIFKH